MDVSKNIGFGCVSLTLLPFEHQALQLLNAAYDEGIRHFDTAPLYGNGYSEKITGKFLKTKKGKVTVATKFGLSPKPAPGIPSWLALPLHTIKKKAKGIRTPQFSPALPSLIAYRRIDAEVVQASFEKSIKALKTGHIDYYLLHEALPSFLTDEAIAYLIGLKRKGDVGKIGVATSAINLQQVPPSGYAGWDVLQYENGLSALSDELVNNYPAQQHFYHSVFKSAQTIKRDILQKNIGGMLLAKAVRNNPDGKVLFGTSKISNLKNNLAGFAAYSNMAAEAFNTHLQNAIH